jgi:YD repeat-containing protein
LAYRNTARFWASLILSECCRLDFHEIFTLLGAYSLDITFTFIYKARHHPNCFADVYPLNRCAEGTVTKKFCFGLLMFMILNGALSNRASAQLGSSCVTEIGNYFDPGTTLPIFNCATEGPALVNCFMVTDKCAPKGAAPETCPTCAAAAAGQPVSLASGNTFIKENDVRLPGLSGGLTLVRTWNSLWPPTQTAFQIGMFGPNWRANFEERVFVGSDNYVKYSRGDGSFWSFGYAAGVFQVAAPANANATLVQGTSYWTLTFQNGEQRLFDNTSGKLISIIDRNGNATQFSYDAVDRLSTITDPVSRHLYFGYGSGSSLLVTSVTSNAGISLSYTYDTQGRLNQVTNPDSTTYTFQYNSQSLISSVTDQNGKILESHTYDASGRGLTSSRANGVEALTISYSN